MNELKPCPFCGGEADLSNNACQNLNGDKLWTVECCDCGIITSGHWDKKQAVNVWNTRTPKERGGEK